MKTAESARGLAPCPRIPYVSAALNGPPYRTWICKRKTKETRSTSYSKQTRFGHVSQFRASAPWAFRTHAHGLEAAGNTQLLADPPSSDRSSTVVASTAPELPAWNPTQSLVLWANRRLVCLTCFCLGGLLVLVAGPGWVADWESLKGSRIALLVGGSCLAGWAGWVAWVGCWLGWAVRHVRQAWPAGGRYFFGVRGHYLFCALSRV